MSATIGVIDARVEVLTTGQWNRRLSGKSLLEWVVRRVAESARLDHVIVAVDAGCDGALCDQLPKSFPVVAGRADDRLATFAELLEEHQASAVVRIGATCPFIDAAFIDRLVATADAHPSCDYISYCCRKGRPALLSTHGLLAEYCRGAALLSAAREATRPEDRRDVMRYVYSRPERFACRFIPVPAQLDRSDVRLVLERAEDWEHAEEIFEALGHDQLDWQQIAGFLSFQPDLRRRMAELNREHSAV